MPSGFVNFRSSPELDAALDAEVNRLQSQGLPPRVANRSAVARALLLGALGSSRNKISGSEALKRVWGITEAAVQRTLADVRDRLPQYVDDELNKFAADDAG